MDFSFVITQNLCPKEMKAIHMWLEWENCKSMYYKTKLLIWTSPNVFVFIALIALSSMIFGGTYTHTRINLWAHRSAWTFSSSGKYVKCDAENASVSSLYVQMLQCAREFSSSRLWPTLEIFPLWTRNKNKTLWSATSLWLQNGNKSAGQRKQRHFLAHRKLIKENFYVIFQ